MRLPKISTPHVTAPKTPSVGGKPTFTPRPDINGNLPGQKPGFNLDGFTPSNPLSGLKPNLPNLGNPLSGLMPGGMSGLGNRLGGLGDMLGGAANGAAGLLGTGMNVANMLPGAMGMMGPAMGPSMMDPRLAGILPQDLGAGPVMDPSKTEAPAAETGPHIPSANDKRPAGDNRSAADIVKDSPVLANLGRQKDIKFDELCKQTGVDPKLDIKDSKQNPDAVYRLAKVLEYIDSSKSASGGDRSGKVQAGNGDGNIEGITKDGDARHGTEAGMVKDFAEQGYSSLGSDHQLPTTNDSHVKEDGSNKDNFQWFAGEVGKNLWFIPGVSNVLTGIGNSEGGALGAIKGGLGGMVQTWKGAAEGVLGGLTTGKINPLSMALGAYTGALQETTAAPQVVKDIAGMLPF